MAFVDRSTPLAAIIIYQTLRNIGISSIIGPFASWGLETLPRSIVVDGSAFFTTVRQACAALGTALMMIPISMTISFALGSFEMTGYNIAFAISGCFSLATLIISLVKIRG